MRPINPNWPTLYIFTPKAFCPMPKTARDLLNHKLVDIVELRIIESFLNTMKRSKQANTSRI